MYACVRACGVYAELFLFIAFCLQQKEFAVSRCSYSLLLRNAFVAVSKAHSDCGFNAQGAKQFKCDITYACGADVGQY